MTPIKDMLELGQLGRKAAEFRSRAAEVVVQVREEVAYKRPGERSSIELAIDLYPDLVQELGSEQLIKLILSLQSTPHPDGVVDLGAGRDPLRGLVFLGSKETIAVDPGYDWYEARSDEPPDDVYGSTFERDMLFRKLKKACKNINAPHRFVRSDDERRSFSPEVERQTIIRGERSGELRSFHLVAEDAATWVTRQTEGSIPNLVVWRAFLPSEVWGEAISKMPEGGIIITSGYGWIEGGDDYTRVASGVDIGNSALPRNGDTKAIGLVPLTTHPDIYFYQKQTQVHADEIAHWLRANPE